MNKKTRQILIKGAIALIALAIVAGIAFFGGTTDGSKKAARVGAESIMTGAEGYLYYNDEDNNIWRRDIGIEKSYMISENMTVLSAYKEWVLASSGNKISVIGFNGEATEESYGVITKNAQLSEKYIYYKNAENGYIMRIDRETGTIEEFIGISIDTFLIYGDKVVFTTSDHKMIYVYDMITQIPMGYFGDKDIAAFDVDEDYLVYSDAANGYKTTKMSMLTGEEEEIKGVKTKTLEYRNGRVFYIENHKKTQDSYKLMINEIGVH